MKQNCKVGVNKIDITPDDNRMLIAGSLHTRGYDIIKDPLYIKTIVISSGDSKIAIITLDLIRISTVEKINKVKTEIEKKTGIKPQNVLICPSHTHSGPYTDTMRFEPPFPVLEKEIELHKNYMEKVYECMVESVSNANNDLEDCKLGIAKGEVEGVSHHRRVLKDVDDCWNTWLIPREEWDIYPAAGPVDTCLYMLVAVTKDDKVKAVLYNYALHANSNRTPRSISADYPAYVQKEVAKELGEQAMTFFIPGACGNINPNHPCEFVGEEIGKEIVRRIKEVDFNISPLLLYTESVEYELPHRTIPKEHEGSDIHFQSEEIKRKWPTGHEYFLTRYKKLLQERHIPIKVSLTGIKISEDIALITNPSEFFTELGMEIKNGSPFKHTIVIELTNGGIGYVPTRKAFEQGGYETFYGASRVDPEAGEIIVKESLNILKRLKESK